LDEDRADEVLSKRDLVKKVIQSLELHAVLEEKHIYPLIKEFDEMKAFEAIEEHALVKAMISSLRKTRQDGSLLTARVKVLEEIVSHHVKEEENDLFPQLRQEVEADKLRLVGARMLKTMKSHKEVGKDAGKTVSKGRTKRTASRTAARTTRKTVRKAARKTPLRKAG
jgi:hemerythrin superfamily protein